MSPKNLSSHAIFRQYDLNLFQNMMLKPLTWIALQLCPMINISNLADKPLFHHHDYYRLFRRGSLLANAGFHVRSLGLAGQSKDYAGGA